MVNAKNRLTSRFRGYHLPSLRVNSLLIIVNNAAARARQAWPIIHDQLRAAGVGFDFYATTHAGDATARTRTALRAGITTVAVVGGDGTLSEAAEGFFEFQQLIENLPTPINSAASLAVLPAGTGDDFARGLMGRRAALEQWVNILSDHCQRRSLGGTRPVDALYGLCNNFQKPFICLNASSMGIGGETAARVAAQGNFVRAMSGEARFAFAALAGLAGWRERRVRVLVDDIEMIDASMNLAAVANGLYAGGGMMFSPEAKLDDGKLDVVTASGLGRTEIVRELARIHKGGHVANPKVRIVQGTKVRIETFSAADEMKIEADGNVRGVTPVEFRVMPHALRFVVTVSQSPQF